MPTIYMVDELHVLVVLLVIGVAFIKEVFAIQDICPRQSGIRTKLAMFYSLVCS